ncbi:hemolysin family protein [Cochlodiniinecator piscidefendens]|uniref:hemolysin family protein n=1 Tax=Cochlodiniinecator piscidefendens TaxID=2715756 RepID=UPI00140BF37B|nr:hemolysin family protein [Cochlodiniinecator piscidefendens]
MGDTIEGSSIAAHSAREDDNSQSSGFFSRIIGALSPSDLNEEEAPAAPVAMPTASLPGMLNLRRMRLEDVATPKAEIASVPSDISKDDLVQVFRDSGLTRIPVYDGTLDSPIGLVHLKDMALRHGFNGNDKAFDLPAMVRPLLFAPPSMPLGVLLQKMQTERIHMALVIDEYGGVDGLVTIEDLIEQVVGEIEDEHDQDEAALWTEEMPGCYLIEARTPLEDFQAETNVDLVDGLDDEEIDTLGGLVFVLTGRVPVRGEMIPHPNGAEFEVVDADPRRIKRLRVRLAAKADDA